MTIAVLSDIHDNIWNLERAMEKVNQREAEVILFLGDFCAPFTLAQMAQTFRGELHCVFGNNDGDPFLLSQIAAKHDHVTLHGQFADLSFDQRHLALNHYPAIAEPIARSGVYDAVFSGHDHTQYVRNFGPSLWANPGEIMGRFGEPSFGIYETQQNSFAHVAI